MGVGSTTPEEFTGDVQRGTPVVLKWGKLEFASQPTVQGC